MDTKTRSKAKKQSKLTQIFKVPIKILCKARDFYVKGMEGFAAPAMSLPKSYSVRTLRTCDGEDLKQLLRAASTRIVEGKVMQLNGMARSYSVSVGKIGRIEEDKPCAFEANLLYPSSRSRVVKRS